MNVVSNSIKTQVIAFSSYKGGTGRTTALANVAWRLAQTKRVGCIDFDIESCGLYILFGVAPTKNTIQDFLIEKIDWQVNLQEDKPDFNSRDVFRDRLTLTVRSDSHIGEQISGELYLIPAITSSKKTALVTRASGLFAKFKRLQDSFAEFCDLDYLLIDCRSGISELVYPIFAFTDKIIIFFRWGKQHRQGTMLFVGWLNEYLQKANPKAKIGLVPSVIPQDRVKMNQINKYLDAKVFHECNSRQIGVIYENPDMRSEEKIYYEEGEDEYSKKIFNEYNELTNGITKL